MENVTRNEKPLKPLCLEYGEAKEEICNALTEIMNKNNVPLFLWEIILSDFLNQVTAGARREREKAAAYYDKKLAEYEKRETEV